MSISSGDSKSASFEDFLRILPDLEMSILIFDFGLFSNVFLSFFCCFCLDSTAEVLPDCHFVQPHLPIKDS